MPDAHGRLESYLTLVLEGSNAALDAAHRELYPERIPENIPLCMTVLYPWIPMEELDEAEIERAAAYFAGRPSLSFDLVRVAEFPEAVAYAVPEPDDELRANMRGVYSLYPQCPPYGREGFDPPPHCTLGRLVGPCAITKEEARARVEPLLPAHYEVGAVTLMEEYEPDRMRVATTLPFAA